MYSHHFGGIIIKNDIITMELDVDHGTLTYFINDTHQGIASSDVELESRVYHLPITMNTKNSVQLIDLQQIDNESMDHVDLSFTVNV